MENEKNIIVVGSGLTGLITVSWLIDHNIDFDWIFPNIDTYNSDLKLTEKSKESSSSYSPKLSRYDYKVDQSLSSKLLGLTQTKNFRISRSVRFGGLGNYWGANLAKEYTLDILEKNSKSFKTNSAKEYVEHFLPSVSSLDLINFKENIQKDNIIEKISTFINSNTDNIHCYPSDLCLKDNEIRFRSLLDHNDLVYGNFKEELGSFSSINKINGVIQKIIFENDSSSIVFFNDLNDGKLKKRTYSKVFLCAGSIESFRIVHKSLLASNIQNLNSFSQKIQHHPILTAFCFIFKTRVSRSLVAAPMIDLVFKQDSYINLIPLIPALEWKFKNKQILKLIFLNRFSKFILAKIWIANFYFSCKLSDSYISFEENIKNKTSKVHIDGSYHPSAKNIMKDIYIKIYRELRKTGFFLFFSRVLSPGTDQHTCSSLISLAKKSSGNININKLKTNLFVLDSSTEETMILSNPTFYFLIRTIEKLENIFDIGKNKK